MINTKLLNVCFFHSLGDRNLAERVVNVLTSLPFIVLGIHAPRWYFDARLIDRHKSNLIHTSSLIFFLPWGNRKNLNTKLYANSLIGVGVASSLYHSSRGKLRKYLRWADYTMIATATVVSPRKSLNKL